MDSSVFSEGITEHHFKKRDDIDELELVGNTEELEEFAREKAELSNEPSIRKSNSMTDPIIRDLVNKARSAGRLSLDRLVRLPNGEITSLTELADNNMLDFRQIDNFHGDRSYGTKYFADLKGDEGNGWEITKFAYLSRIGRESEISENFD